MQSFFLTVQFCTRIGAPGRWSGTLTAPDIDAALEQARQLILRRHRGATKLDIHAVADRANPPAGATLG